MRGSERGKWSLWYHVVSQGAQKRVGVLSRTVAIRAPCFFTCAVRATALSSPFCFVQPFEKRSLVGSLYLEIGGLRPSSHQKIRRSRFRIMPACAYRSTTAHIRAQLPKPSPPLSAEGSFEKKVSEKLARDPGRGKFTGARTSFAHSMQARYGR